MSSLISILMIKKNLVMKIQYRVIIFHKYLKLLFTISINVPYAIMSNISMFVSLAPVYCHLVDLIDFNSCFNILVLRMLFNCIHL